MGRVFNIVTVVNVHSLVFSVLDIVSVHQFFMYTPQNIMHNMLYSKYTGNTIIQYVCTVCGHNIAVGG